MLKRFWVSVILTVPILLIMIGIHIPNIGNLATRLPFLEFVLAKYEVKGVEELDEEKLPILLNLKYHAIADAEQSLGSVEKIRSIFFAFQKNLYAKMIADHEYR